MLQTVFKLEKNEIKPAAMIFPITFLWGTSQMFSYAAANAIFLNVYGASFLSYTFIFNAVLIPLTGMAIMKASERFLSGFTSSARSSLLSSRSPCFLSSSPLPT